MGLLDSLFGDSGAPSTGGGVGANDFGGVLGALGAGILSGDRYNPIGPGMTQYIEQRNKLIQSGGSKEARKLILMQAGVPEAQAELYARDETTAKMALAQAGQTKKDAANAAGMSLLSGNPGAAGALAQTGSPSTAAAAGSGFTGTQQERAKAVYEGFINRGLHPKLAAGMVGNIGPESSFDPSNKGDFDKATGQYTAFGLHQARGSRFDLVKQMAEKRGTTWNDREAQMDAIAAEFNGADKGMAAVQKMVLANPEMSAEQVAGLIARHGERPSEAALAKTLAQRQAGAAQAYKLWGMGGDPGNVRTQVASNDPSIGTAPPQAPPGAPQAPTIADSVNKPVPTPQVTQAPLGPPPGAQQAPARPPLVANNEQETQIAESRMGMLPSNVYGITPQSQAPARNAPLPGSAPIVSPDLQRPPAPPPMPPAPPPRPMPPPMPAPPPPPPRPMPAPPMGNAPMPAGNAPMPIPAAPMPPPQVAARPDMPTPNAAPAEIQIPPGPLDGTANQKARLKNLEKQEEANQRKLAQAKEFRRAAGNANMDDNIRAELNAEAARLEAETKPTELDRKVIELGYNPRSIEGLRVKDNLTNADRLPRGYEIGPDGNPRRMAGLPPEVDKDPNAPKLAANYEWNDPNDHSKGAHFVPGSGADPASVGAIEAARQAAKPNEKPLAPKTVSDIATVGKMVAAFDHHVDGFDPKFGGYKFRSIADAYNLHGAKVENSKYAAQSAFWRDYEKTKISIRHGDFGASLTPGEKKSFDDSDIDPSMTSKQIKTNLERQQKVAADAARRIAGPVLVQNGNPDAVEFALGVPLSRLGLEEAVAKSHRARQQSASGAPQQRTQISREEAIAELRRRGAIQ